MAKVRLSGPADAGTPCHRTGLRSAIRTRLCRWTAAVSLVSASGSIDARGQARFQVASVVIANGRMHGVSGSGKWEAPSRSCAGRWQAAKI